MLHVRVEPETQLPIFLQMHQITVNKYIQDNVLNERFAPLQTSSTKTCLHQTECLEADSQSETVLQSQPNNKVQ